MRFQFSYLDDDVLILDAQEFLSQPSGTWRAFDRPYFPSSGRDHAYYRPLVTASYAVDAQRSGVHPLGYRVTNLVLHASASGLLFLLLLRLGYSRGIAHFGGLLLAVHPAVTEVVAWIPGRNDSLLAVWALASWLLLISARTPRRWGLRLAHLVAWLLALFTKEAAIVLPVVYLAYARLVERRPWRDAAAPWLLLGWVATLGIYAVARAAALPEGMSVAGISLASLATGPDLLAGSLGKLVLPVHLSVLAIPEDTWRWPGVAVAVLFAAALLHPGIRRGRLAFGGISFLAFVASSVPASNLLVLENRLYLPAIAVIIMVVELAATARLPRSVKLAGGTAMIAVLATVSFVYSGSFRDRMTFSLAAVRGSPHSALAHRNLGVAYHVQGDGEAARREYEAALVEDAAEPVVHNNLGVLLMAKGRLAEAEQQLRDELAINPRYAQAHRNLAIVLRASGREDEAAPQWEASLGLGADDAESLRALIAYYGARDPARSERFRALLETRGVDPPGP